MCSLNHFVLLVPTGRPSIVLPARSFSRRNHFVLLERLQVLVACREGAGHPFSSIHSICMTRLLIGFPNLERYSNDLHNNNYQNEAALGGFYFTFYLPKSILADLDMSVSIFGTFQTLFGQWHTSRITPPPS